MTTLSLRLNKVTVSLREVSEIFLKKYSVSKFAYSNLNEIINLYFKGRIIFGKYRLQVLAWRAAMLTEVFRRFPQLLQANATTCPQIWLPTLHSAVFVTHYFLTILQFDTIYFEILRALLSLFCHEWYEIKSVAWFWHRCLKRDGFDKTNR
jgi:hypothetical protein